MALQDATHCFRVTQLSPGNKEHINAICLAADGSFLFTGGDEGAVKVWDLSTKIVKQTMRIGSAVLALKCVDIKDNLISFLAGASDGSITCFVAALEEGSFRLAFRTYLHGVKGYMHIDSINRNFAAVGGNGLSIWEIKTQKTKTDVKFSLSETRIPGERVTAVGHARAAVQPRTAHFLARGQGVLIAFVPSDVTKATSYLVTFRIQPWQPVRAITINRRVGMGVLDNNRDIFAFTNLLDGIDFFSSTMLSHQGSITQTIDRHNNLAIGLVMTAYVVVGGVGGAIWLYDRNTGGTLAHLQNPTSSATVQIVTAGSQKDRNLIAGGSTDGTIHLWEWDNVTPRNQTTKLVILCLVSGILLLLLLFVRL